MEPPEPELPVLRRAGFTLRGDVFDVDSHSCVSGSRLLELFAPERLRLKRDQKSASEEADRLFCKPFFTAQLRYYGIKFRSTDRRDQVQEILKTAVLAGKCQDVPESVLELERSMRLKYAPAYRAWELERDAWKLEWNAWRRKQDAIEDAAWNRCSTPGEQATLDLDRFVNHYFLTDGEPDPSKTKEPLALYGFQDRATLHRKAERIPGLDTCSGGTDPTRTLCIGWDRRAVGRLVGQANAHSRRMEEEKMKVVWDDAMEEHRSVVEQVKTHGPRVNPKSMTPAALQKSAGSYVIRCKELTDGYASKECLTLDIEFGPRYNVMQAAVDFSVIKGTMLLALSDEILDDFTQDAGEEYSDDEEHSDDDERSEDDDEEHSDDEEDSEDEYEEAAASGSSKRRRAPVSKSQPGRPKKRARAAEPERRVFVRFRGRETGEGEVLPDPKQGHLDFTDGTYTSFGGILDIPYVGTAVEIEGRKVHARPQRRAESWNSFSEAAYEYARVRRWG